MSGATSQPCTGRFPFHFVHINGGMRSGAKEGERERVKEREKGEVGATKGQEKGTEGRGGGERRAQSGAVCQEANE